MERGHETAVVVQRRASEEWGTGDLVEFVRESNRIEGILRDPTENELDRHADFLRTPKMLVAYLESFVMNVAAAELRVRPGMNVYVGDHTPPPGGRRIRRSLGSLCDAINDERLSPFEAHVQYETLHPFMDGNGRSGRALWAWQMLRSGQDPFSLPFLHRFYYQTLSAVRPPEAPKAVKEGTPR